MPQLTAIPVLRVWVCDDILSFLGLGEAFGGSEAWDEIDASLGGVDWYSHRGPAAPDLIGCSRVFRFRYHAQFCFAVSVDTLCT